MNPSSITAENNKGAVFGDNFGNVAGGNIFMGDYNVSQEPSFREPTLKEVDDTSDWVESPQARQLANRLSNLRLLVLSGNRLDETMVARRLAWQIREDLRKEGRDVCVREWIRTSAEQKWESLFTETGTTILLIPEVRPRDLGHRLDRLLPLLKARNGFAVMTTDSSKADWCLTSESDYWIELSWESFYGAPFLYEYLVRQLRGFTAILPAGVLPQGIGPGLPLIAGITLMEVVQRLQSPDAIRRFLVSLAEVTSPVSEREVRALLGQFSSERDSIYRWYSRLERRDQALALGLALFDALPDDQVFAGLELIINNAWRSTDPFLTHFDYSDLGRLGNFFRFMDLGSGGGWIEVPSERERDEILRAAWTLQRRRLLATLPVVTELVKGLTVDNTWEGDARRGKVEKKTENATNSSGVGEPSLRWRSDEALERALFGTLRRRSFLQQAIIGFLSRVALLSTDAVETCFHELAVEGSEAERRVIAQAFAEWRQAQGAEELFKLLHRWWREGCRVPSIAGKGEEQRKKEEKRLAATRATVALAVGYASLYDPPNQLHASLREIFPSLLQDHDPLVRNGTLEITIPLVLRQHLRQLHGVVKKRVAQDESLVQTVGFGIALAYGRDPLEASSVIRSWLETTAFDEKLATSQRVPGRERLLATVVYACGYIKFQSVQGCLGPEDVFEILRSVLNSESHPIVRRAVLVALGLQAVHSFEVASSIMTPLVAEVTLDDRAFIVGVLVRAYLHQRQELKGGDDKLEVGGIKYDVWTSKSRPLTPIEVFLYTWVDNSVYPVAQQVALQTFAAIAATDLEWQERAFKLRPRGVVAEVPVNAQATHAMSPRLRILGPLGWMSVFLSAPADPEARPILAPLLAEVVEIRSSGLPVRPYGYLINSASEQSKESPQSIEDRVRALPHIPMLLGRLQGAPVEKVKEITVALGRAIDIYRWRWPIVIVGFIVVVQVLKWLF